MFCLSVVTLSLPHRLLLQQSVQNNKENLFFPLYGCMIRNHQERSSLLGKGCLCVQQVNIGPVIIFKKFLLFDILSLSRKFFWCPSPLQDHSWSLLQEQFLC